MAILRPAVAVVLPSLAVMQVIRLMVGPPVRAAKVFPPILPVRCWFTVLAAAAPLARGLSVALAVQALAMVAIAGLGATAAAVPCLLFYALQLFLDALLANYARRWE